MALRSSPGRLARGIRRNAQSHLFDIPTYLCPVLLGFHYIRSSPSTFPQPRHLARSGQSKFAHAEAIRKPEEKSGELSVALQRLPIQCPGCGALAQTLFEDEPGFYDLKSRSVKEFVWGPARKNSEEDNVVEEALKNAEAEPLVEQFSLRQAPERKSAIVPVCGRCHNLKHHQLGVSIDHPTIQSIQDTIDESPHKYNHIYHVLDAADFPMSLIPGLHKLLHLTPQRSLNRRSKTGKFYSGKKTEVSFIITRSDLLAPMKEQVDRLMPYLISVLRDALGRAAKDVRLGNVRCVSAKRGWWTKELKEDIWKRGGGGWMVGKVNVGKSQLIHEVFPKGRLNHEADGKPLPKRSSEPLLLTTIGGLEAVAPEREKDSLNGIETQAETLDSENRSAPIESAESTFTLQQDPISTPQPINTNSLLPPLPPTTAYPPMPLISSLPGTTASPIRIPFGTNKGELIDLPGLSRSVLEMHIQPLHRRSLVMQSRVTPEQKVIKAGQSLLLGGCIRITPHTPSSSSPSTSNENLIFLTYAFTPLSPHLTSTSKATAIQTQSHDAPHGVENISLPGTGDKVRSAGVFKLKWDVTRQRTGPITRKDAAGIRPERLPYRVMATDLLIEGVGWVEVVAQVRRKREEEGSLGREHDDNREAEGREEEKEGEKKDEVDDVNIPAVEVFSPEGKFIGQRRPMNAWALVSNKPGASKLRGRPRKAMKGAKKLTKARRAS